MMPGQNTITWSDTTMQITIPFDEKFPIEEYKKIISFISKEITEYQIFDNCFNITFAGQTETAESLERKIKTSMQRFRSGSDIGIEETIAEYPQSEQQNLEQKRQFYSREEILKSDYVTEFGEGMIGLKGYGIELYKQFDAVFRSFALEIGAKEEQYPVLLPLQTYNDTGYLRNSPQYSMFCSDVAEDIEELKSLRTGIEHAAQTLQDAPAYALSPSACFHVYEAYRGKTLPENAAITLCQSVFRNEGRFSWKDFGRLRDYHVREIVFIGDVDYVEHCRNTIMEKVADYMEKIGLQGKIVSATDCFVVPELQKFKRIQLLEKRKYEWQVAIGEEKHLAVASFNLHDENFTRPFHIKVQDKHTVTGCVGFGLERMVLAYFSQYL